MTVKGYPVDRRFDRRIEQFNDQAQQAHGDQDGPFGTADIQPERQRHQQHIEQHQLAESRFTGESCAQTVKRIAGSVENTFEAGLALERR
ncbi:hypothetical protein D3C80_1275150 [compost metagenome]